MRAIMASGRWMNQGKTSRDLEAHVDRAQRAHQHLPFASDVEQAALKSKGYGQAGEDVGDRLGQALRDGHQRDGTVGVCLRRGAWRRCPE